MNIMTILFLLLAFLIVATVVLALIYLSMVLKSQNNNTNQAKKSQNSEKQAKKVKTYKAYSVESIFDFMEFDKIQDNMIVQKNGKKFLMAIECQGINYDLMSDVEKNSVEIGFVKVLNTLTNPIQIYIQTRTINLENSLEKYKDRLESLQNELSKKQSKYNKMLGNGNYTEEELRKQRFDIIRQENMCEYGKDIISNTERMSLNQNILRKKYYIIVPYYMSNTDGEYLDADEIRDAAFSELYTRCQSIIRSLSSAEVIGKVLNSNELVDLLYNAYNRDESEIFGINKAKDSEYDNLYVTAQDVLQKRMEVLDKEIEEKALDMAEEAVIHATDQIAIDEKEENIDELIKEYAKQLVDENEEYLGGEVVKLAKEEIDKKTEGGKSNAKKRKTRAKIKQ